MTGPGDQRLSPFFALTLLLSLPFYALGAVLPRSVLPMQIPYAAVMVVCPMLAALWLWRRQGARFRISRILDTHAIHRPWVAALGVAGLIGAVLIAGRLSGGEAGAGLGLILLMLPLFVIAAIPEEIGWTAYAGEAGLARHGPIATGLMIGLIWAVWHWIPWALLQGRPLGWVLGMTAITIAARVLMVLIYARTGRSLGVAVLAHALMNAASLAAPGQGAGLNTWLAALLIAAAAAVLWLITKGTQWQTQ